MMGPNTARTPALTHFLSTATPIQFSIYHAASLETSVLPSHPPNTIQICLPPSKTRASTLAAHHQVTYLGKANEEELVVGEAEGWQGFLIPILLQPVLIRLETREHSGLGDNTNPTVPPAASPQPHGPTR